jgi:hypothetical protein
MEQDKAIDELHLWEATMETDIGVLIKRHLQSHPPPRSSEVRDDLEAWAQALVDDGRVRLRVLGRAPLRRAA